jgi:hypothetical protein
MCDICLKNGEYAGCQHCGCLICFYCKSGDDVLRPAAVSSSGDVYCDRCCKQVEREVEEEYIDDEGEKYLPY